MEVKAGLPQGVKQGSDLIDLPLPFGAQQHPQTPQGAKPQPRGHVAPFLFVEEDQLGIELERLSLLSAGTSVRYTLGLLSE